MSSLLHILCTKQSVRFLSLLEFRSLLRLGAVAKEIRWLIQANLIALLPVNVVTIEIRRLVNYKHPPKRKILCQRRGGQGTHVNLRYDFSSNIELQEAIQALRSSTVKEILYSKLAATKSGLSDAALYCYDLEEEDLLFIIPFVKSLTGDVVRFSLHFDDFSPGIQHICREQLADFKINLHVEKTGIDPADFSLFLNGFAAPNVRSLTLENVATGTFKSLFNARIEFIDIGTFDRMHGLLELIDYLARNNAPPEGISRMYIRQATRSPVEFLTLINFFESHFDNIEDLSRPANPRVRFRDLRTHLFCDPMVDFPAYMLFLGRCALVSFDRDPIDSGLYNTCMNISAPDS